MKRDVIFKGSSFTDFNEWQVENPKIYRKIAEIIEEIRRNPFSGKGKPEPLKHNFSGYWSRRITDEHRLIYTVNEIPMRQSSHQPKMNMWVFHVTVKNQIIYT